MRTLVLFIFNLVGVAVWAGSPPTSFNYQGRLLTSGGTAVTSSSVTFTIGILSQDGTCTLYQETHNKDLSSSNGFFSLNIGSGTNTGATALTILQVFDNTAVSKSGESCSYTPSSGDYRQLNVRYDDGSGQVILTPNHIILSTPNAMVAQTLQGKTADGFVQVQGNITQNKLDDLASKHTELMALANGTSSTYAKSNELVGASVPTVANGESLRWNTALNGGSGGWEAFTPGSASAVLTVGGTAPIVAGGTATNPVLSISAATTSAAGSMSSADKTKLDGVETGATADQSASEILAALLTVDGTGTGLDADLLDGTELSAIPLLSGRSGGQTLVGGTGASENLVLDSTSNGTKGNVVLNPTSGSVGIGTSSPASVLDVAGRVSITGTNGSASNPQLRLLGTNGGDTNTGFFKPGDDTIGVATSGTERVRVDSSGNVGIGTGSPGQKLTVAGTIESTSGGIKFPDGSTQTSAAGDMASLFYNRLLADIRASKSQSNSVTNIFNGVVDPFGDTTGVDGSSVDAGVNTTAGYVAGGGVYYSQLQHSTSLQIGDNVDGGNETRAGLAIALSKTETISKVVFFLTSFGSISGSIQAEIWNAPVGTVGTDAEASGAGDLIHSSISQAATIVTATSGSNNPDRIEFTFSSDPVLTAGNYLFQMRHYSSGSGGIQLKHMGADVDPNTNLTYCNTYTCSYPADQISNSDATVEIHTPLANMTLVSPALTASAAPTRAYLVLAYKDVSTTAVLGTDFTVEVSRDNGTTYGMVTLTDSGAFDSDKRFLTGSVDISGQPSGTQMRYRIKTLNLKDQQVYGVGMIWE